MLGRLLKYELKSTARIFLPFLVAIVCLSGINKLTMTFLSVPYFKIPQTLLITMYIFLIAAAFVLCVIVSIQRFYKNLLGREGYLMFTLPVTTSANILSKFLVSLIWFVSTLFATLLSVFILLPEYGWILNLPAQLALMQAELINQGISLNLGVLALLFCVFLLMSFVFFIMQIYVSVSVGQLSNSHKLLSSFGAYMGTYLINQVLLASGMSLTMGGMLEKMIAGTDYGAQLPPTFWGDYFYTLFGIIIVVQVILTVAYFFVSRYLLNKKLNLE